MTAARDSKSFVALVCMRCNHACEKDRKAKVTEALDGAWMAPRLLPCMPIHMAAAHLGFDSELWAPMESILKSVPSEDLRVRIRAFQGKQQQRKFDIVHNHFLNLLVLTIHIKRSHQGVAH